MPFSVADITQDEFEALANTNESHYFELKSADSFDPIAKTLSGFGNAEGGRLIVGISDKDGKRELFQGYTNEESANGHITQIKGMFAASPESVDINYLRLEKHDGLLLDIEVGKSAEVIYTPSNKVFIRLNAQNIELKSAAHLQELAWRKGQHSYEDVKTDLDIDFIDDSEIFSVYRKNLIPQTAPRHYLKKEHLTRDNKATVAGVLLFDDNPQSTVTQGAVKIYRYKTISKEGQREELASDPITVEGPAHPLVYEAVKKTAQIIERIDVLGAKGFEKIKYPPEAIHEVICNAVIHRDYSIHDYIHIRVFDNRVEVESPGKLPGHITVKNILKQRFARNKRVVRILNKFPNPPNKDVGEGLNTTFNSMRNMNLKDPVIDEREQSVCVTLAHEPLATKEKIIEGYLLENKVINNTKGREICFEPSESRMRKIFQKMIAANILEMVPGSRGKGTKYQLQGEKTRPPQEALF